MAEPTPEGQRTGPVPLDPRLLQALAQASDAHTGMPERLSQDIQQLLAAPLPRAVTTSTSRPWGGVMALLVLVVGAGLATWFTYWQHSGPPRHPPIAAPSASAPLVAEAAASSTEPSPRRPVRPRSDRSRDRPR